MGNEHRLFPNSVRTRTNTLSSSIWTSSNSDVARISTFLSDFFKIVPFNLFIKAFCYESQPHLHS